MIVPNCVMALVIIILPLALFLFFLLHALTRKSVRFPPGPRGLPLIGNLHHLDNSNRHFSLWKLSQQYGPLMFLRLGSVPTLVVSSAEMAKLILKTYDLQFSGRPALLGLQKLSYNGLDLAFTAYGDYWREIRKLCMIHLFSPRRVQQFRPIREDEVSHLIEKISKSAVASQPVNLSEMILSTSINIICRFAFGKRYEDEGSERSRSFYAMLKETQAMFLNPFFSDYIPCLGWLDKLTGINSRLEKIFKECDIFYQELIEEHLHPKRPKTDQKDIIDVLLQIRKDHGFIVDLTFEHIKAVLMNVFVAGTDTSAASTVWAMTYLIKNPRAMDKTQEEVRRLIGKKGFVYEDDVQRLPYLKAVVKETMRLHPSVPLLVPRESTEKCIVDGYEILPKTMVFVNAWAIGRDPEAWDNPEEFYPERFVGTDIDVKGQNFELVPFGAGRRICPGLHMGMANVELALANLLYKFDWKLPAGMMKEDVDLDGLPGIAMLKKNDLCLVASNHI